MADIRKLAPILLKWEAGAPPQQSLEAQWAMARRKGFSNHPNDTGGATMCGVTLGTYKRYRQRKGLPVPSVQDLKEITLTEWLDILKTGYWDKMQADRINNQSIANLCVDNVWGSGPGYIPQIQQVLHVKSDGIVGPVTLAAINNCPDQRGLFNRLKERRRVFYCNIIMARPANEAFRKGWMNRLMDFKYEEEGGGR